MELTACFKRVAGEHFVDGFPDIDCKFVVFQQDDSGDVSGKVLEFWPVNDHSSSGFGKTLIIQKCNLENC